MQKEQPETPKLRRMKKVRNSTPEPAKRNIADSLTNVRAGSSHHRATMAPSDFSLQQSFSRRRFPMDRTSMLPTQISLDSTRIMETECNDIELKLLYDNYLQKIMIETILKKKAEEKEKLFSTQLATIAKEYDRNAEKLFKLKTRERDIVNLTKVQNEIDSQITDVNKCTKEDIKTLEGILSQLNSLLRPLDVLLCSNIILPNTREEWEETSNALKSCSEILKSIMDIIGTKNESYQNVSSGIKEFLNTYNDIENHRGRLEKELGNLQALVLKTASLSLMQSQSN